jgi:hypothetical protein
METCSEGYHSDTCDCDCVSWLFHTCVKSLMGWHFTLNLSTMSSVTFTVSSGPVWRTPQRGTKNMKQGVTERQKLARDDEK